MFSVPKGVVGCEAFWFLSSLTDVLTAPLIMDGMLRIIAFCTLPPFNAAVVAI